MNQLLKKYPLVVADIGASGGHEQKWDSLQGCIKFIEFEPDPRSKDNVRGDTIRIPKALGAYAGIQKLHLTKFPDASSLFPMNTKLLSDYGNYECHEVIGVESVELDTLDHCIKKYIELAPHFIKIDAEGAELNILEGGQKTLASSVLGLRVEIAFQERQLGAPLFGEVDKFLREQGFVIHMLSRDHWIRKNGLFALNTHPQIIWGDAIYFISRDRFMEAIKSMSVENRVTRLVHFVLILLCHGAHDYALEIVQASSDLISEDWINDLKILIERSQMHALSFTLKSLLGGIIWGSAYLLSLPIPKARRKIGVMFRTRSSLILQTISRQLSRGGPCKASVSDIL